MPRMYIRGSATAERVAGSNGAFMEISRGLDGLVVDTTSVSQVTPETNSLIYRGYPVQDLADQCTFEEVAYLLWYGDLPNRQQLAAFQQRERSRRAIDADTLALLERFPKNAHGMDLLRTAVSYLGMRRPDAMEMDAKGRDEAAVDLLAKIPTIVAAGF